MEEIFVKEWIGWVVSTIGAILVGIGGGFIAYFKAQLKEYKKLLEKKEHEEIEELIDQKLETVINDIEDLRNYVRNVGAIEQSHMNLIIASYRYRLVQLCKLYLKQGYMTQEQYDQLSEFYKVYSGLGGNGQAKDYYDKTVKLEIKNV